MDTNVSKGIRKIKKGPTLVDSVVSRMCCLIHESVWREGERVASENRLASEFNVSRIVIREALQNLRGMNLIVTRQGLGSFVCNPNNFTNNMGEFDKLDISEEDFQCLSELRLCIELRAASLAVTAATQEDLDALFRALQGMKDNIHDLKKFTTADFMFHEAVVEAGHSRLHSKVYQSCRNEIYFALQEMNSIPKSYTYAIAAHTKMYKAIVARDLDKLSKIYKDMFEFNKARYKKLFRD